MGRFRALLTALVVALTPLAMELCDARCLGGADHHASRSVVAPSVGGSHAHHHAGAAPVSGVTTRASLQGPAFSADSLARACRERVDAVAPERSTHLMASAPASTFARLPQLEPSSDNWVALRPAAVGVGTATALVPLRI